VSQLTNARIAGTAYGEEIDTAGLAGDTSGGTYVGLYQTHTTNGGAALAYARRIGATGYTAVDDLSLMASGTALTLIADNVAIGWGIYEGANPYIVAVTTNGGEKLTNKVRMTGTDGVASGDERVFGGNVNTLVAPVTLTNTNVETTLGTYTIPANTLKAGTSIKLRCALRCTGNAAADTMTHRIKLGGTTILQSAAGAMVNNDVAIFDFVITARAAPGAAASVEAVGSYSVSIAGTFGTKGIVLAPANYATNGALALVYTGQWSAASASDIVICEQFIVDAVG
jgi:hypothetical protein